MIGAVDTQLEHSSGPKALVLQFDFVCARYRDVHRELDVLADSIRVQLYADPTTEVAFPVHVRSGVLSDATAARIENLRACSGAVANALKRRDRIVGTAAVAARGEGVGMRADYGDFLELALVQRQ